MPSIEGLEVLFTGNQLTQEKWCKFLEIWRKAIEPWLEKLTLKPIGQLEYLRGNSCCEKHRLDADPADTLAGLKVQGIFPDQFRLVAEKPGTAHFWGISRRGKWLLCKIEYAILRNKYEKAIHLWVIDASIEKVLSQTGFSPREIAHDIYAGVQERDTYYSDISRNIRDVRRTMNVEREAMRKLFNQLI